MKSYKYKNIISNLYTFKLKYLLGRYLPVFGGVAEPTYAVNVSPIFTSTPGMFPINQ